MSSAIAISADRYGVSVQDGAGVSIDFGSAGLAGMQWVLVDAESGALPTTSIEVAQVQGGLSTTSVLGRGRAIVHARWEAGRGGVTVLARLENPGHGTLRAASLELATAEHGLRLDGDWRSWLVYKMGWNVSAASGMVPLGGRESQLGLRVPPRLLPGSLRRMLYNEGTRFSSRPGEFESEWLAMLTAPSGESLVAGFCGFARAFGRVRVDGSAGSLRVQAILDGCALAPGVSTDMDPILVASADGPFDCLRSLARAAADRGFARVRPLRLWCSWYSGFYDRVDEAGLLANLHAIAPHRGRIDCFQLDDGWQAGLGDWLRTNRKFPRGIEPLARDIAAAGFSPGIWTAPFALAGDSPPAAAHPDWLVRDRRGRAVTAGFVMGATGPRWYNALDTTVPDAIAWLRDLYCRLYGMGWRVFKLDFLTAAAVAGTRHDPGATRGSAYRAGIQAIREAMPDDAVLLAGISPILANAGIFDCQRLGPDTAYGRPRWRGAVQRLLRDRCSPCLHNNVAASMVRAFTDGVLWSGDCDAILQDGLPPGEARLLAAVNALAGSTTSIGHDFRHGPFDFSLLDAVGSWERGEPRVLDMESGLFPRHLALPVRRDGRAACWYAVLNPTGRRSAEPPRLAALGYPGKAAVDALDFFDGRPVVLRPGQAVLVDPRSARLFLVGGQTPDG